ncbi:MAG: hypothetical protein EXR79_00075 [Myxococcales bacterium]|nr:hypothetical protein [Myxococcales bacterium]
MDRALPQTSVRPLSSSWARSVTLVCTTLAACATAPKEPCDPNQRVCYPITLAADLGGRWLVAVGANFDRQFAAGSARLIDTATNRYVRGASVAVPSFAGVAALLPPEDPTAATARWRALVTARDDDSLTVLEIDPAAPALTCGPLEADGRCNAAWRLAGTDVLGSDPLGLAVGRGLAGKWFAHVAATTDGKVTVFAVTPAPAGKPVGIKRIDSIGYGSGLTGIATVPGGGRAYVSDARAPRIHAYRVEPTGLAAAPWRVVRETGIDVPGGAVRDYGRGIRMAGNGGQLYVAWRSPAAVAVVDIAPGRNGVPRHSVAAMIPIGGQPADIAVAPTGPGGRDLVYASSFGDDSIWIVDPMLRQVVGVVRLSHAPYAVVVVRVPTPAQPDGRWTLYAALFNRHEIIAVPLTNGLRDATAPLATVAAP